MQKTVLFPAIAGGWFLTLLIATPAMMAQDGWGHLTGKIIVQGAVPAPAELTIDTNDRQYCLARGESFTDRSLLVGPGAGLQNVFVMMYFGRGDETRPAVHPTLDETNTRVVELNNENCRFQPGALCLRAGQPLALKNSDAIGHNCHFVTMKNEENVSLGAGQSLELTLENADRVPGIVKCDVHPWMEALILVRDEPYMTITDEHGSFLIENIPAGEWTFQFWHKRPGFLRGLTRDGQSVVGRRGEIQVNISAGETLDLGELKVAADDLLK